MLKISDLNYDWKLSDIDKVQKNKLKVFSFFAGAGGSSMGLIASKNKSSSTCSACPSLNFFFLPLFSSAIIFAPQNKVQGAEASKISKWHRAFFFGVRNDIGCEVDLANSPVFHFKKYAHVKFSEIQEKISEQGTLKEESRLKFLWNKRIYTDNSLEDVVERTEGKKHSLFSAGFIKKDKVCFVERNATSKPIVKIVFIDIANISKTVHLKIKFIHNIPLFLKVNLFH
jgi:hypothetical protein